jgi:hypothetical protein
LTPWGWAHPVERDARSSEGAAGLSIDDPAPDHAGPDLQGRRTVRTIARHLTHLPGRDGSTDYQGEDKRDRPAHVKH